MPTPVVSDIYTNPSLRQGFEDFIKKHEKKESSDVFLKEIEFLFSIVNLDKLNKRAQDGKLSYVQKIDAEDKFDLNAEEVCKEFMTGSGGIPLLRTDSSSLSDSYYKAVKDIRETFLDKSSAFSYDHFSKMKEEIEKSIIDEKFSEFLSKGYSNYLTEQAKIKFEIVLAENKLKDATEDANEKLKVLFKNLETYLTKKKIQSTSKRSSYIPSVFVGTLFSNDAQKEKNADNLKDDLDLILNSDVSTVKKIDKSLKKLEQYLKDQKASGGVRAQAGESEKSVLVAIKDLEKIKKDLEEFLEENVKAKIKNAELDYEKKEIESTKPKL